jgi:hypothetical protein
VTITDATNQMSTAGPDVSVRRPRSGTLTSILA